jgi:hypothetical protein
MVGSGDGATALQAADVTVLMMGNSHTTLANLPAHLRALLAAGLPGKRVSVAVSPDWLFLEERAADTASLNQLRSRHWKAVVLQAQKCSSSGLFSYSTQGAEQLVQVTRLNKSLPVLFAEWPRLGVTETARIYDLHVSIATAQPACVPWRPTRWTSCRGGGTAPTTRHWRDPSRFWLAPQTPGRFRCLHSGSASRRRLW